MSSSEDAISKNRRPRHHGSGSEIFGTEIFDTLVIGGGIVGASAAHRLASGHAGKPRSVAMIEAFSAAHGRGSSHGDGRIVRFTYPETTYLDMAKRAFPAWTELENQSGTRLLETTGGFECGPSGSPEIDDLRRGMGAAGIPFETLSTAEARRRFPQFAVEDGHEIIFQEHGAIVRAELAVRTLWSLFEASGGLVADGCRAENIQVTEDEAGRLFVVTGRQDDGSPFTFRGRSVVVAGGGWSQALLRPLGLDLPLDVSREVVAYFSDLSAADRDGTVCDHRVGVMPTLIDYDGESIFYALPRIDVPGVKIGWHHAGPATDPDLAGEPAPRILRGIADYAERRFPHLDPEPFKALTCLYTNTPDYHFIVDRHPEIPEIVVATGFSGHGFKFGPVIGELVSELVMGREPSVDLSLFSLERFSGSDLERRTNA